MDRTKAVNTAEISMVFLGNIIFLLEVYELMELFPSMNIRILCEDWDFLENNPPVFQSNSNDSLLDLKP
jgi:hypothetical protein